MDPKMMQESENPVEDKAEGGVEEPGQSSAPTDPTAPTPPADQQGTMEPGSGNEGEEIPNVTPEEQKQYDTIFTAALRQIYDEKRMPFLLQKLMSDKAHMGQVIGHTAAMIMTSIKGGVEQKGKQVTDDVLFAVGQDVVGELCHIAVGAKLMDQAQLNDVANQAIFEGMKTWGAQMQANGSITDDVQQKAQQDLADRGIQLPQPGQGQQQGQPQDQGQGQPHAAPPQGGIVGAAMQPGAQ